MWQRGGGKGLDIGHILKVISAGFIVEMRESMNIREFCFCFCFLRCEGNQDSGFKHTKFEMVLGHRRCTHELEVWERD